MGDFREILKVRVRVQTICEEKRGQLGIRKKETVTMKKGFVRNMKYQLGMSCRKTQLENENKRGVQ
jgi:hypothetical protein